MPTKTEIEMKNLIRCIAVDDEPLALDILIDYIGRIPFLKLEGTFDNAMEAMLFINGREVDLIFLDIQMEGLSGMQLMRVLSNPPEVILTTAYDQYAVEGFELNAADYLMKPISFERFVKSVDRVFQKRQQTAGISDGASPLSQPPAAAETFFFVKTENRLQKVFFDEVLFIEGQGDYLRIVTPRRRIMTLTNFSRLEQILPSDRFMRVHKSFMVAIDKIETIERNRIRIGEMLIPVSDSYRKDFFRRVTGGDE